MMRGVHANTCAGGDDIDYADHLRLQPHISEGGVLFVMHVTPPACDGSPAIAISIVCCHCPLSLLSPIPCRRCLLVGAWGYIEYSFGMLRRIDAPQARDGGWIWRKVHGGRGDLLWWELAFCSTEAHSSDIRHLPRSLHRHCHLSPSLSPTPLPVAWDLDIGDGDVFEWYVDHSWSVNKVYRVSRPLFEPSLPPALQGCLYSAALRLPPQITVWLGFHGAATY